MTREEHSATEDGLDIKFNPDLHETEEFQPAMLALSHFIINWNWVEHFFNVLLWRLSGDIYSGAAMSAGMGNESRSSALLALAKRKEVDPHRLKLLKFCATAFSRLRQNRNSLVHAHSITYDGGDRPRWIRASRNPAHMHNYVIADIEDIVENLNATSALYLILLEVSIFYGKETENPDLTELDVFELPKLLKTHPIEVRVNECSENEGSDD